MQYNAVLSTFKFKLWDKRCPELSCLSCCNEIASFSTKMKVPEFRRKEAAEFNMRREERLREAEEKTAKKRLKRKKKNQRKKEKMKTNSGGEEKQKEESSDDDGNPDDQTEQACTKF
ncbi:hypothetical protein ACFXTH_003131 [Malus domestica]